MLGRKHADTLDSVYDLADLLKTRGKINEAIPFFERDLRGQEEIHGINHPDTIYSAKNLMEILIQQGRIDEANELKLKCNI